MKVNVYYEMVSFINLVAIGGKLRGKNYSLVEISNTVRISDRDSPFEIRVLRMPDPKNNPEEGRYTVIINLHYRPISGGYESEEVYRGPEVIEEDEWWDKIHPKIKRKCICGVVMDIEYLENKFLSRIELPSSAGLDLKLYPLVSSIDFFGVGWGKIGLRGSEVLKKFIRNPELFYVIRFDYGTVIVEKNFSPDPLNTIGREIHEANVKGVDTGAYSNVWTLPIHVTVLDPFMRNLFYGSCNEYTLGTIEASGQFPLCPVRELTDQVSTKVLDALIYNSVREVEGRWWTKEDQEGILITDIIFT